MKTRITELLGVEHPIVQGGMHFVGLAPLAGAVSEAGGLGIITARLPKRSGTTVQGLQQHPLSRTKIAPHYCHQGQLHVLVQCTQCWL